MKILYYLKRIGLGILVLAILVLSYIYIASSVIRNKTYDLPLVESISIPTDSTAIAEGFRQTRIAHCNGCHGEELTGRIFHEDDQVGKLVAPNISHKISEYSDAELYRLFRSGLKKNGQIATIMPFDMYCNYTDETIKNIIAYLRTIEPQENPGLPEKSELGFFIHMALAFKMWDLGESVQKVLAKSGQPVQFDRSNQLAFGEYLASTACSNCHGQQFEGGEMGDPPAPPLSIIKMYSKDQFHHMIRTGETLTKGDKSAMTDLARKCLKHLHDEEVDAIYAFLNTLEPSPMSDASLDE
jgi:cytochrome c553